MQLSLSLRRITAALCCTALSICCLTACEHKQVTLDSGAGAEQIEAQIPQSDHLVNFTMPEIGEDIVVMTIRDYGDVKIRLFPDQTEKGAENFKKLVESGFYDELKFHRIADGFVIQGGDPRGDGNGGQDAWGSKEGFAQTVSPNLCHFTGAVGYAIGEDKLNKSQFYFVTGEMQTDETLAEYRKMGCAFSPAAEALYKQIGGVPYLDGGYEIFGQIFDGMEYVLEIQKNPADAQERPQKAVVIEKAVVTQYDGTPPHYLTAEGNAFTPESSTQ